MKRLLISATAVLWLAGCGGGGNSSAPPPPPAETTSTFEVSILNLTNAQPLSPPAIVVHDGSYRVFEVGSAATAGLETLAEGGDNSMLVDEAAADAAVLQTVTIADPVPPGGTGTAQFTVTSSERAQLAVSVVTMLVNTNDAFTAWNSTDLLGPLQAGQSVQLRAIAYDAGTEADTEGPGTIPGPADGGEGFNAARDDEADRVSMHPGTVTASAGLATSVLNDQHRFDNPVATIRVTRVN